ncbi:hypothetical protein KFE25_008559 [Diacronema lutheri]|uniref:BRO1 domain-containing protein n=1 Tax=Diacronema lutheri TaxID=2081491 RepID=A0A8J6CJN8_DIALT|nr:hypothetical protein KFE25_008559 [Diacronema lutheri]
MATASRLAPLPASFFALPLKSTEPSGISEAIDWPASLLAISQAAFGKETAARISRESIGRDADAFRRARNAATIGKPKQAEGLFAACRAVVHYLGMLDKLEAAAGAEGVRRGGGANLHFVWRNAFSFVERKLHAGSLAFERAGLYFNLGAMLTIYATSVDVELQATAHALQCAAGCISEARAHAELVADGATSLTPLTEDMRPPCLGAVENLLLGQAQVCFAERAASASPAVQVKLWGQAALFLRNARDALPASLARADRAHIGALASFCLARAHGCAGTLRRAERQHGVAVAHLALALSLLDAARASASPSGALREQVEMARVPLAVDCECARRENDRIYFEREPPAAELARSIECTCMVRPLPLDRLGAIMGEHVRDDSTHDLLHTWPTPDAAAGRGAGPESDAADGAAANGAPTPSESDAHADGAEARA